MKQGINNLFIIFSFIFAFLNTSHGKADLTIKVLDVFSQKPINNASILFIAADTLELSTNSKGIIALKKIQQGSVVIVITHKDYTQRRKKFYLGKHKDFITIHLAYNKINMNKKYAQLQQQDSLDRVKAQPTSYNKQPCLIDSGKFTFEAQFPGGDLEMKKFLFKNIEYPEISQQIGDQGKVFVTFNVSKSGKLSKVKILKSVSSEIDREVLRVIKLMPDWTPAYCENERVDYTCAIPVNFTLY